jgi:hypothetical protein
LSVVLTKAISNIKELIVISKVKMVILWVAVAAAGSALAQTSPDLAAPEFAPAPKMWSATTGTNVVDVSQMGDGGYANVTQIGEGNRVGVTQDGPNIAIVTQTGNYNGAWVNQYGSNIATVTQTGNYNGAWVNQYGSNIATVTQTGNRNTAIIEQRRQ